MGGWVKLQGGGFVNLAHVAAVVPQEVSSGIWRPVAQTAAGTTIDRIDTPSTFASLEDCSAFIAELVHGYAAS